MPDDDNAKWAFIGGLLVVAGGLLIKWATQDRYLLVSKDAVELSYCDLCRVYHADGQHN